MEKVIVEIFGDDGRIELILVPIDKALKIGE